MATYKSGDEVKFALPDGSKKVVIGSVENIDRHGYIEVTELSTSAKWRIVEDDIMGIENGRLFEWPAKMTIGLIERIQAEANREASNKGVECTSNEHTVVEEIDRYARILQGEIPQFANSYIRRFLKEDNPEDYAKAVEMAQRFDL